MEITEVSNRPPLHWRQKVSRGHFSCHGRTLTGVELQSRLNEDLDKKGKRLLEFFRSHLMWSKEVKAVLKEALKDDGEGTDRLAAMMVMCAVFLPETPS